MCIRDSGASSLQVMPPGESGLIDEQQIDAGLHPGQGVLDLSLIHISEPTRPY